MHPYHTEAIIGNEGKIELTLPFKRGEKVAVVVIPYKDVPSKHRTNVIGCDSGWKISSRTTPKAIPHTIICDTDSLAA